MRYSAPLDSGWLGPFGGIVRGAGVLGALLVAVAVAWAGGAPLPPDGRTPEKIDYAQPDKYVRIPEQDGDGALIKKTAAPLKDKDAEQTFRNIHAFIARVPHVPEGWEAEYRDFGKLLQGFDHTGCACHALLFANLARACGIPTVYIKSSRHEWIRGFVATGERGGFDGHVFLEVFVGDRWKLLDAQGMRIWDTYDASDPELPGGLLAYEKGWDHFAMVHSTRRDLFIKEALERWKGFDVSKLRKNETPGRALLPEVFAITVGGEWELLTKRTQMSMTFDRGYWKEWAPKVKGKILLVTSIAGRVGIPDAEAEAWLPAPPPQGGKDARAPTSGLRTRRLNDGTLVVLLFAPGWNELMALIWSTDFEQIRCDFAKSK
jgi:hypothetical protein